MKVLLVTLLLLATLPIGALWQSNSAQSPVEIKGEAHHHPKFENEFVRIWDVTVPGGEATLWHIHRNDNVVITLAGANLRLENASGSPVEAQWKFGEVRFAKATYTHRAINIGTTPFHNLTIELLKPANANPPVLAKEGNREPVLENDRVRVFRVTLEAGESTPIHNHPLPGLSIAITGGELEATTEGNATPVRMTLPATDVRWRPGTVTHSIKNVGKTRFEAVDIEFK
jgi:quercetin dioxygenase-like cupin family protein